MNVCKILRSGRLITTRSKYLLQKRTRKKPNVILCLKDYKQYSNSMIFYYKCYKAFGRKL